MKKVKLIMFTLLFIFCLTKMPNQVDAATIIENLFGSSGYNLEPNECIILQSGYYAFTADEELDKSIFDGDFDFYGEYFSGQKDENFFYEHLEYDPNDQEKIKDLFKCMNEQYKTGYGPSGLMLLSVRSYAVIFNNTNRSIDRLDFFYAPTSIKNTTAGISGGMTHIVDIDNLLPLSVIKGRYTATDNVDGDITSRLTFKTNYVENSKTPGTFYIIASVTDSSNHTTTTIDYITVKDFYPPVITLKESVHYVDVFTPFTTEEAKQLFIVSDNATPTNKIRISFTDNYKNNYKKVGTYTITAQAFDDAHNRSEIATLSIVVQDNVNPDVNLTAGGDTIIADHQLSDEEILALFTPTDNYYTLDKSSLKIVGNTCNGAEGVEFTISIQVTDAANNTATKNFKYYLTDTQAPIITVKDTLYLQAGTIYTNEELIAMLQAAGILTTDYISINFETNYLTTINGEDIYELSYFQTLDTGEVKEGTVQLYYYNDQKNSEASQNNYWFLILIIPLFSLAFLIGRKIKSWQKSK